MDTGSNKRKPDFLPLSEAAGVLGVPAEYLQELAQENALPGIESGGVLYVHIAEARLKLHNLATGWYW